MPKLKTHKGTTKRIRRTKTGKLVHGRPNTSHFLSKKSSARKRRLARENKLSGSVKRNINRKMGA